MEKTFLTEAWASRTAAQINMLIQYKTDLLNDFGFAAIDFLYSSKAEYKKQTEQDLTPYWAECFGSVSFFARTSKDSKRMSRAKWKLIYRQYRADRAANQY